MPTISRASVTEQISAYIKECIESGKWKVGSVIPSESELTTVLGVSRSSLRNAISQFTALGILHPRQGRGCFLTSADIASRMGNLEALNHAAYQDVSEVLRFRLLIEPFAARAAAEILGSERVELLTKLHLSYAEMQKWVADRSHFIDADLDFHRTLARYSGNRLVYDALDHAFKNTAQSSHQLNMLFGYQTGLFHHGKILEAVERRDPNKAEGAMQKHLSSALELIQDK